VAGSRRAGEVVDLVDFEPDRHRHVVPDQLEVGFAQQVGDVRLLAGEKVVEADHVVPEFHQPLAQMGTEKPGTAGDQNTFERRVA
jgi:hypothetical protein